MGLRQFATPASPAGVLLPYLTKSQVCFIDAANDAFANDWTAHVQMTLEAHFAAIQIGFANSRPGAINLQCQVSVMSAAGDPATTAVLNNGGVWVNAGVGGNTINAVAAAVAQYGPTVTWGDVIPLASLDRSDGGTLPILCVRIQQSMANNGGTNRVISAPGGAVANGYPMEVDNANVIPFGRIYRVRCQAGVKGIDNINALTTTNNSIANAPPILVRYWLRNGYGRTFVLFCDSILGAFGQTTLSGWSAAHEARRLASSVNLPVELAVWGQSGATTQQIATRCESMVSHFKGCTALMPNGSPNSIGVPISVAGVNAELEAVRRMQVACSAQGVPTVMATMFPTSYAAKAWGASDQLRVAMNAARLAASRPTLPVIDLGGAAAGPLDVNGQQTFPGSEADGLHPTSTTQIALGPLLRSAFAA